MADEHRVGPELGGERLAGLDEDVADDDLGALGHEQPGLGRPLPAGATRHDRHLAVESTHRGPLPPGTVSRIRPDAAGSG